MGFLLDLFIDHCLCKSMVKSLCVLDLFLNPLNGNGFKPSLNKGFLEVWPC